MLKNVPKLTFDENQKLWSLEFTTPKFSHETTKKRKASEPDELTRFLQDYWDSKKSTDSLSFAQDKKHLKLPFLQKELVLRKEKFPQDNLFSFLKEHMEKSTSSEKDENKINLNLQVNLQQ